jgi:predicted PurR-regulated permease PerM
MDFSKIKNYVFIGMLIIITIIFFSMLKVFAYPIFWAAIIAGMFYPVYKAINKKIKIPNLSTAITMTLILFIIVIPVIFVSILVVRESIDIYSAINQKSSYYNTEIKQAMEWVKNHPLTDSWEINELFWAEKFSDIANSVTSFILSSAKQFTQNSIIFFIMFFITFYTLFFFLRDGEKLLKKLMHLCPLGNEKEKMLYSKFVSTTRATLKGSLIVGIIQGALGGLMFAVAGIKGAIIWGLLMAVLAAIPTIGPYFIWLPAAIIMILIGRFWTGMGMILFGALVIGTIDNILRPILVGKDAQMHPLMVMLSMLGGMVVFGISGFIIGPIIAALLLAFWEMYEHYYKKELDCN